MNENQSFFKLNGRPPVYQLLLSLMLILIAGGLLFYFMLWICSLVIGIDLTTFIDHISSDAGESNVILLRLILIIQDISLFIIPGTVILLLMKLPYQGEMVSIKHPEFKEVVLMIILGFSIFPITSFTGQINAEMHLPQWLSGVEKWMVEEEDHANSLIDLLLSSHSFGIMMLNVLIVAILPAIGEEFIFRGVFQKIFTGIFRSGHLAIWFIAFMFSALHFQFFGFIPRFILGLIFGYLYFWSGTLWLPVISHFVNNAFPVIMAFIQGMEKYNATTETSLWKQALALPLPIIVVMVILIYFRGRSNNKNKYLPEI